MTAWIEQWHHDITPVSRLPLPKELGHPACMTGRWLRTPRRVVRQWAPRSKVRDCCEYHGQDWAVASEAAIRLLGLAHDEGLAGEEAGDRAVELARAEGISPGDFRAIQCLVSTADPLMLYEEDSDFYGYIYDGRHRIQAMIDQGVKRTIVARLVLIDPDTGLPA